MIEISKGNWDVKGTWHLARLQDGTRKAILCCPKCGKEAGLTEHTIIKDGTVNPSVVCPHEGCDFHDYIKLIDWPR